MKNILPLICLLSLEKVSCGLNEVKQDLKSSKNKTALIFGVTGQDGSYLAEFLLKKNYIVHGVKRRSSSFNTGRIDNLYRDQHDPECKIFFLHYGDLTDTSNAIRLIQKIKPCEIYNLAAQSHVQVSFETPEYTANCDALGTLRILEAIRILHLEKKTKFYQASTSEMFGKVQEVPQKETTPFYPRSPYGVAKLYAYWITRNYREAYGLFACNGILFNHESERRGATFVTRKITRAIANIVHGSQEILYLGNLDAHRDWGYAPDYVEAMWLILQKNEPGDYVVATGKAHTVREFIELAFKEVGIEISWQGKGIDEIGIDKKTGKTLVKIDEKYFRPSEVEFLLGDASKAENELPWRAKTSFEELVHKMVTEDVRTKGILNV